MLGSWFPKIAVSFAASSRAGRACKKRGRPPPAARRMAKWGGRDATSITTREVARWLTELDRDPALSSRAVNLHRQVMRSIFAHACRDDTFGLTHNPVAHTEKRREPDPAEIITYWNRSSGMSGSSRCAASRAFMYRRRRADRSRCSPVREQKTRSAERVNVGRCESRASAWAGWSASGTVRARRPFGESSRPCT